MPTTGGTGNVYVTGTMSFSTTAAGTETKTGDVTQLRGLVLTGTCAMNDPRVSGTSTARLSVDEYTNLGPEWGTVRLER